MEAIIYRFAFNINVSVGESKPVFDYADARDYITPGVELDYQIGSAAQSLS